MYSLGKLISTAIHNEVPGVSVEEIQQATEGELLVEGVIPEMQIN